MGLWPHLLVHQVPLACMSSNSADVNTPFSLLSLIVSFSLITCSYLKISPWLNFPVNYLWSALKRQDEKIQPYRSPDRWALFLIMKLNFSSLSFAMYHKSYLFAFLYALYPPSNCVSLFCFSHTFCFKDKAWCHMGHTWYMALVLGTKESEIEKKSPCH